MRKLLVALSLIAILLFVYAARDVDLTNRGDSVVNYSLSYTIEQNGESKIMKDGKHIFTIKNNLSEYAGTTIAGIGAKEQFELQVTHIAKGEIRKCDGTVISAIQNHDCEFVFSDGSKVHLNVDPTGYNHSITVNTMSITLGSAVMSAPAAPAVPPTPTVSGPAAQPVSPPSSDICQFALKVALSDSGITVDTLNTNKSKITVLKNSAGAFVSQAVQSASSFGFRRSNGIVEEGFFYIFYFPKESAQYRFQQSIDSSKPEYYPSAAGYIEVTKDSSGKCTIQKK